MTLDEYRREHGLNQKELAEMLGMSPQHLNDFLCRRRDPSFKTMVYIKRATDGAVPLEAWDTAA